MNTTTRLYYQARPESDQTKCSIVSKNRILVANELYTTGEVNYALNKKWITQQFIDKHLIKVELLKNKTYFFFGARFACSDAIVTPIQ